MGNCCDSQEDELLRVYLDQHEIEEKIKKDIFDKYEKILNSKKTKNQHDIVFDKKQNKWVEIDLKK